MKIRMILYCFLIVLVTGISGCGGGNRELKKDATVFADAMCRNMEAMQKLRATAPADTANIRKFQAERNRIDAEMTALYEAFRKKYGAKVEVPEFTKEYRKYLNEAMLECKFLSKEDRVIFERQVK
jgi:spermidine/putrescine-binding protein